MHDVTLRRAEPSDSDEVAALFRRSRDAALPVLPRLHTAAEDRAYFRDVVFTACEVWLAEANGSLAGFCAFREGWVDHLYVDPAFARRGVGTALLDLALRANATLQLWTFQRNAAAREFYERHGFVAIRTTAGENEEREPDVLYRRSRA